MTDVVVTYQAKEQVGRLSVEEQEALSHLLNEPNRPEKTKQVGESGRFVSRLGQDKRVYWTKSDDGDIVVLSVVVA